MSKPTALSPSHEDAAQLQNKLHPQPKWEPTHDPAQGAFYSTDGRWSDTYEGFGPNMVEMQGATPVRNPEMEALYPTGVVQRAVNNSPPPLDDVGGCPEEDFDELANYHIAGDELLPRGSNDRKDMPICTGVLDYFPLAIAEIARVSKIAGDKHHPGQPMHWEKGKSTDHADCLMRHLLERGMWDQDGMRHTAKVAWRALALLQEELERS